MVDHLQQRMSYRNGCPFSTATARQSPVLGLEVRVFLPRRSPGRLAQRSAEPNIPFGGPAALPLARRLLIAGTDPRPTRQMGRRGKLTHVRADLGDDVLDRLT